MKKGVFIFIFLFLSASISFAASGTPTIFSYQGRLTDASGNLLGGSGTTYYFSFSIWDASSSGNKLWPSGEPATTTATVRQGVFNKDIDVSDYDFNTNQDIYLEVRVSSDNTVFQTLTPRQRISSSAFSQLASAVSGTGQSSFGTTTPISDAVVTIEATSTSAIPVFIRGFLGQVANLFQIQDSTGSNLFVVNNSGNVGVGTTTVTRKLNVWEESSNPQLRLGLSSGGDYGYGEFYVDASGNLQISSTGGGIWANDENLWICSGIGCGIEDTSVDPAGKGNIIVETSVIFGNKFRFEQINASTTRMYDTIGSVILEFDEAE